MNIKGLVTIPCLLIYFSQCTLQVHAQGKVHIDKSPPQEGWFWQYPKPQGNSLRDIFIFDSNKAIAVGDLGTVIKTTDGGENWDVQHHAGGVSYDLYDVYFFDELRGWAAGRNDLIKTEDGGKSWTEVKTNSPLTLRAVHFVDADTGIAVGEDGIVLRTTDGGISWDIRTMDEYIGPYWLDIFELTAITFIDKNTGWIIGAGYYGNQIYKTTDCGRTWQWNELIIQPKIFSGLLDICFTDKNNGFIVGDMGVFLKTTDGGITWLHLNLWEKYQKDEYQFFYSTFFTDSLNGWIVGGNYFAFILKTTDGGENWTEIANNNDEMKHHFYKIRYSNRGNDNSGWIVGQFGMIYRTTDYGENWIAQKDEKYNFISIHFINENIGWAVGEKGIILHTEDGGINWHKQNQNDSLLFSSVYVLDNQNVFAVGEVLKGNWPYISNGIILRTSDGGEIWERQTFDTLSKFSSIVFTNDSIGWITVTNGILLKTSNRGTTWIQYAMGLKTMINNLQFINEDIGWLSILGDTALLKTTDGGKNWNSQLIDSNFTLSSFHFVNADIGWAVGDYYFGENIFKTIDGGYNWFPSTSTPIAGYTSIYFINETTGWAAGFDHLNRKSSIIKTTNGGNTWIDQQSPSKSEVGLLKVSFLNESTGWVVGDGIIKTIDGGGIVSVKNEKGYNYIPNGIELCQNYPNPFNPETIINYQFTMNNYVTLKVYDILGQEIITLVNEEQNAGRYKIEFDAIKFNLSSGVYFYRLNVGKFSKTKKMILLR